MADVLKVIRQLDSSIKHKGYGHIRDILDVQLPKPSVVDVASIRYYLTKYLKGATFNYGDVIGWFYVEDEDEQ